QPFTFIGKFGVRLESANLYQMRARYYDAQTGRFLSIDPLWPRVTEPREINPYIYAAANPIGWIDPTGLAGDPIRGDSSGYPWDDVGTIMQIGETMVNIVSKEGAIGKIGSLTGLSGLLTSSILAAYPEQFTVLKAGKDIGSSLLRISGEGLKTVSSVVTTAAQVSTVLTLVGGAVSVYQLQDWARSDQQEFGNKVSQEWSYKAVDYLVKYDVTQTTAYRAVKEYDVTQTMGYRAVDSADKSDYTRPIVRAVGTGVQTVAESADAASNTIFNAAGSAMSAVFDNPWW
ncbi:MAG: hypothetical protein BWK80_62090, partial [Desulfobacteraceae bacterium IS3]